jgi:hypothetical protein
MKKSIPQRRIIYTKDVENLTGKSAQTARRLLREIKAKLGKGEEDFVTVAEFCACTGITEEELAPFLGN